MNEWLGLDPETSRALLWLAIGAALVSGRGSIVWFGSFLQFMRSGKWPAGNGATGQIAELRREFAELETRVQASNDKAALEHAAIMKMLEHDAARGLAATKTLGELAAAASAQAKATDRLNARLDAFLTKRL